MTAQRWSVDVPFSSTGLQLGASVGGPGASLCTAGDVLVDSVGVMDIQSKGAFMGQTAAAMQMLSASVQKVHSQGTVEIFAGGGKAPSGPGLVAPSAPVDAGRPGLALELATSAACIGLADMGLGMGCPEAVPSIAGAVAAAGGGGTDIVERAKANVKMAAGKKISGLAPYLISSNTLGKYEVKALLLCDFTTLLFSNFALAKFEVKALNSFETLSVMWDLEGTTSTTVTTKNFEGKARNIKMDGDTTVTKVMKVSSNTPTVLHDDLECGLNALLTGRLVVHGKSELKGILTVKSASKVKGNTTVDGKLEADKINFKASVVIGL